MGNINSHMQALSLQPINPGIPCEMGNVAQCVAINQASVSNVMPFHYPPLQPYNIQVIVIYFLR